MQLSDWDALFQPGIAEAPGVGSPPPPRLSGGPGEGTSAGEGLPEPQGRAEELRSRGSDTGQQVREILFKGPDLIQHRLAML